MARKPGDVIIVSELDRLGRNKTDTLKELQHFKEIGVLIMILEIPTTLVDYSKLNEDQENLAAMIMETVNNMLIEMYACFAQAETQKREKRQREGIQAKKDRGEWDNYGADQKPLLLINSQPNTHKSYQVIFDHLSASVSLDLKNPHFIDMSKGIIQQTLIK